MDRRGLYWMSRIVASMIMFGTAVLGQSSGYSYMTYYFSSDGSKLYATTVTSGQMQGAYDISHEYTATTGIMGPAGTQSVGCGTANSGYVPANQYHSIQESCYIELLEPGQYVISSQGTAFCAEVMFTYYNTGLQQTPVNVPASPALSLSNSLWYFGGPSSPSTFTQGATITYVSANNASGGSFAWAISSGADKASFEFGSHLTAKTTTTNTVPAYSVSYSVVLNDVTISLIWTEASGIVHAPGQLNLSIDSPYTLAANPEDSVALTAVADCSPEHPTQSPIGWWQRYGWTEYSKFGVIITGVSFIENFTNITELQQNTWTTFQPNGQPGQAGNPGFHDDYCTASTSWSPSTMVPQTPLTENAVDSATQSYNVGSQTVGLGLPVQSQTLTRYVDHPTVTNVISPVRSQ